VVTITAMLYRILPTMLMLSLQSSSFAAPATQPADQWNPLFNGKDLTGWYTFLKGAEKNADPQHIFQVHDGIIHIYADVPNGAEVPYGYISSEREFGDCRIRFEYKWGTKRFGSRATRPRDSGMLYFFTGQDSVWPVSVECQIQENDVGDVYAVKTRVSTSIDPSHPNPKIPTFKDGGEPYNSPDEPNSRIIRSSMNEIDGWNKIEVELSGSTATHIVNGKVNMRIQNVRRADPNDPTKLIPLTKGKILFQAEGAEVMYRGIEVNSLRPEKQ
jgi:hypothetical protein